MQGQQQNLPEATINSLTADSNDQIAISLFEPKKEIRPEYNIGKFAGVIFASPYAKNVNEIRKYNWQVVDDDQTLDASLTVTPLTGQKTPTTTTFRVFLALIQVWEHIGFPEDGIVRFSARQLCNVIGWRWAGTDTANRIYEHLKILSGTSISWTLAYQSKDGQLSKLYDDMSILSSASYRQRGSLFEPEKFSIVQKIRLNPDLVDNMLAGHVRPMNYVAFKKIGNDTTAVLYTCLDLYLHKKPKWERRAVALLSSDLALMGKRYEKRFNRHAKLKEFVRELDGVALFTGTLRLAIEETADGKDWKLVARKEKTASPKRQRPIVKSVTSEEEAEMLADELIEMILRQPRSGKPNRAVIKFLCKLYPQPLLRQALSVAKADYQGKIKKTLTHVFVAEIKRAVQEHPKLQWYDDAPNTGQSN
ncbi:hypothetical protein A8B75_00955 [Sphingomonadales bacterium EhC05]|nr:hypothetical protein A8B75_00955 [Sphingomonadales bacterium EhC05]